MVLLDKKAHGLVLESIREQEKLTPELREPLRAVKACRNLRTCGAL